MSFIRVYTDKDSTKAGEIDNLNRLHAAFHGTGNYLESLFSEKLVNWCREQIQNDFPPDVWDHYEGARAEADSVHQTLARMTKELKQAEERTQAVIEESKRFAQAGVEEAGRLREVITRQGQDLQDKQEWALKQAGELGMANAEISRLKQQIVELKARLYDLEHPIGS